MDWNGYKPYFRESEFACSHSGQTLMRPEFMQKLVEIRKEYNKPMTITSGFRHPIIHPIEAAKHRPGEHAYGAACDVSVFGQDALLLIYVCYRHGIRRIGVQQTGTGRFIHIGMGDKLGLGFPPSMWSYPR